MEYFSIPFQVDRPVFVKIPFTASGRSLKVGDQFKWLETGFPRDRAMTLYNQGFLYHSDEKVAEKRDETLGDGLEALSETELASLVKKLNETVKAKTKSETEFNKKKVKTSKIKWKQIGLIRSWRSQWGHLED